MWDRQIVGESGYSQGLLVSDLVGGSQRSEALQPL